MKRSQSIKEENDILLELWRQAQSGDDIAYCQLSETLYRKLFNYACTFTDDREYIKDIIQDVLLHIWEKRESTHIQYVVIYFITSLRNLLFQTLQKQQRLTLLPDIHNFDDISDDYTIENEIASQEQLTQNQEQIRSAIEKLPKRQKEVVFMKFYLGMENASIAELIQVNRQSVANLLFKATSALKIHLPALWE